ENRIARVKGVYSAIVLGTFSLCVVSKQRQKKRADDESPRQKFGVLMMTHMRDVRFEGAPESSPTGPSGPHWSIGCGSAT
ncbi:hypothetical protein CH063_03493, partial [Colletotrichum higginsianum]